MIEWYTFDPVDTLHFKGGQPMNMGDNHTASSIFPPTPSTISGALRTQVLKENNIKISSYKNGYIDESILSKIGKSGSKAPFNVIGPLFYYKYIVLLPVPYNWFMVKGNSKEQTTKIQILKSKKIESNLIKTNNGEHLYWVQSGNNDLVTLGGKWITLSAFETVVNDNENSTFYLHKNILPDTNFERAIFDFGAIFDFEAKTGIALKNRSVRDGHLYTFNHVRILEDLKLLWGVDEILPLKSSSILMLGGETRFGRYQKADIQQLSTLLNINGKGLYMSLSSIKGDHESNSSIIATGKIKYSGGWDMHKKFHKDMEGYYPAGSIFNKKINSNFLKISNGE